MKIKTSSNDSSWLHNKNLNISHLLVAIFVWSLIKIMDGSGTCRDSRALSDDKTPPPPSSVAVATTDETNKNSSRYRKAFEESLHFFDDIPDVEWELLKKRVSDVQPNKCLEGCYGGENAKAWFQNHYEPDFACRHERRIGRLGNGGKWVCDPHRITKKKQCLIYSVGSNGDFSFEKAVRKNIGEHCEIHTFDVGNYLDEAEQANANVTYHQWGLDRKTGENKRGQSIRTLNDTIRELGHENRVIDIFKIDCEGCVTSTSHTWFDDTITKELNVTLQQILVEVNGKDKVPEPDTTHFFENLYRNGYVIFHKEPNIHYWKFTPRVEYALVKLDLGFFSGMDKWVGNKEVKAIGN